MDQETKERVIEWITSSSVDEVLNRIEDYMKAEARVEQLETAIWKHQKSFDPIEDGTEEDRQLWEMLGDERCDRPES